MRGTCGVESRRPCAALRGVRNSSRRDGSIIAPDGVRHSERNPGKAQQQCPPPRRGGSSERNQSSVVKANAPSRRPYGTAGLWGGRIPRVSPGAIFVGSLREPPEVGRTLAGGSHGVRTNQGLPPQRTRPGAPSFVVVRHGNTTIERLRNSSRRDGSTIAPDKVRRSERNPGKVQQQCPPPRRGGSSERNQSSVVKANAPSLRPYGTAGVWVGRIPRVSPGAIFVSSLREPPEVGRTLAGGSHGVRTNQGLPPQRTRPGAPSFAVVRHGNTYHHRTSP
jgi:hypothetical protein